MEHYTKAIRQFRYFMRYFESISLDVRPVMSGHDTFAIRYGWSKKVYDRIQKSGLPNVFSEEDAIAYFGVGKNMLNAMRHWSIYLGFVSRDSKSHSYHNTTDRIELDKVSKVRLPSTSELYNAKQFFSKEGLDPYLESPSTLWLMHWTLATNPSLLTYYWFFNINTKSDLSRDDFIRQLKEFINQFENFSTVSDSTIKKDVDCFILNYSGKKRKKNEDVEATIESPLTELQLLTRPAQNQIRASRGKKGSLSLHVFTYCLLDFWQNHNPNSGTLALEMATYDECSVGRVFMLDDEAMVDYAEKLAISDYPIAWVQSAGIRQFQLKDGYSLADVIKLSIDNVKTYDYQR